MTQGRTTRKYTDVFIDGYDMSCYAKNIGPLDCTADEGIDDALCNALKGVYLGQVHVSPGTLSGLFDNTTTSGLHVLFNDPTTDLGHSVMVPIGIQADPAEGDPVFIGDFVLDSYQATPNDTPIGATLAFGGYDPTSTTLDYALPWGVLLHANASVTSDTVNSSAGVDLAALGIGTSDTSTDGGYMMYQVTAGAGAGGTAAIKVQDATSNVDAGFSDLISTGNIDVGTAPVAGIVALATTASVRQYVRWQVAFATATSVTFALAFVRGRPR